MRWFAATDLVARNADFALAEEAGGPRFVSKGGDRVTADKLSATLWRLLPGTAPKVIEAARQELALSEAALEDFLYLMVRADIARVRGAEAAKPAEAASVKGQERISVIVITRDGAAHIRGCLASIARQTYGNFEVLVVDNGSSDGTRDIVRGEFPWAKVLDPGRNLYFPGGVNYGLARAAGELLFILNDDTELDPRCLEELAATARRSDRTGAVVPMMKFFGLRGFINGIGNQVRNHAWGSDNFIGIIDAGQFESLREVPSACFGAVMLRRAAVEDVGPLDRGYTAYYEDVDWSYRCWFRGWRIVPAPRAIVYHKFGAFWKQSPRKLKYAARNRLRLVLKLFEGRIMLGFAKRYMREDARNLLGLVKRGDLRLATAYPRAYLSLAWSLPGILAKRARVMRRKLPGIRERHVIAKNPYVWTALNERNEPAIDAHWYFTYYQRELRRADAAE